MAQQGLLWIGIGISTALLSGCALTENLNLDDSGTPAGAPQATRSPTTPDSSQPGSPEAPQIPAQQTPQLIFEETVLGTGGRSQIGVPAGWQVTNRLHASAELQLYNPSRHLYLIALADRKRPQDVSDLSGVAVEYLQRFLQGPNALAPVVLTEVRSVSGYPAIQYEVQGQFQGVAVTYLHTTVDAPNAYYQILAWTLTSRYDEAREELQQVIQSFEPL